MSGAALSAAFDRLPSLPRKATPSEVAVRRVAAAEMSAEESNEYAKKLLALGYLSPGQAQPLAPTGGARPGMTEGAWNNLGMYERETRKDLPAAKAAFEKALALRPDYYSPMFNLAVLYRQKGDTRAAEDWLFRSLAALKSDPGVVVAGWTREYLKIGKPAAARSLLGRAVARYPDNEAIAREKARLLYRSKDCRGAVAAMAKFAASTVQLESLNDLVLFETCLGDREAVERLLARSLSVNPDQPEVARLLEVVRKAAVPRN
jgi:tetratricopeptide (TPR) repeat protein